MGLLRACADAVLIGAGTLRVHTDELWTPDRAFPPAAEDYAKPRRLLKRDREPRRVVGTRSADLDPEQRALQEGALVVTSSASMPRLRARLPES